MVNYKILISNLIPDFIAFFTVVTVVAFFLRLLHGTSLLSCHVLNLLDSFYPWNPRNPREELFGLRSWYFVLCTSYFDLPFVPLFRLTILL
jgi:hypothetical protein